MDPNAEITKAQARQITAYLNELFELMKLKIEISAYVNGKEVSFPISDLLRMTEFNDTIDKIKLSFYGENNVFLADYYMSQDIIDYLTGKPSEIRERLKRSLTRNLQSKNPPCLRQKTAENCRRLPPIIFPVQFWEASWQLPEFLCIKG
jgi:Mor family transcriptional regulator